MVLPAYAGMILPARCVSSMANGAPRVCGDDPSSHFIPGMDVLPAYAGMIRKPWIVMLADVSAPRVCGDDPGMSSVPEAPPRCSPRMRG